MKALITGATGFVGPHLATLLLGKGAEVVALGIRGGNMSIEERMPREALLIDSDIRNAEELKDLLREHRPGQIYHLAGISSPTASLRNPRLTYEVNVGGALNLLEALRELELRPTIVNVSTAHVYASADLPGGLDEGAPVSLATPYATSKLMCETLAAHYVRAFGFQIVTVRPFNHIGPGQTPDFVCSEFARQISRIARKQAPAVLRTGNLEPERDFTDVRDVVEAYWTVATRGKPGEIYNIASGQPRSIRAIVSCLCELAAVNVAVETDPARVRSVEVMRLLGNAAKIRALGWEPRIPLRKSLADILEYWLAQPVRE
jgi:GDP-4-dehydro-6-deoxy-D-mannose reductase